ncbi:MAG TPA: hypothetical protein VFR76_05095, partial [Verrucomicrobiae bacterium]|nr:hypothetical protein [Verrucomicrobiae bacterium]
QPGDALHGASLSRSVRDSPCPPETSRAPAVLAPVAADQVIGCFAGGQFSSFPSTLDTMCIAWL